MAAAGWDVFVSYGHEDAEWVRALAGNLHRTGFEVFFDEWELTAGDRVAGRLEEGIRGSVSGVLVVSPHALSRPWVREEYEALLRQVMQEPGRRLIPVLYADAELPVFLANRLWVDFRGAGTTGPEYDARLAQLVRALRGQPTADRLAGVAEVAGYPVRLAGVAGYLGRVLEGSSGEPVGTCFQVASGVLVTAWHLLDDLGAAVEDTRVRVDPLAGGEAFIAVVARLDPLHDLAVLVSDFALPANAGALVSTDQVVLRTAVVVTGHIVMDDPGHSYRFLDAAGEWAGGTMRDDAVPVGRITAPAVLPGMSGAPVVRESDGAVVGVVSGRYNSADGWLAGTVWVARTEDLAPLLVGLGSAPNPSSAAIDELILDVLGATLKSGNVLLVAGPEIPAARRAPGRMDVLRSLIERIDNQSISNAGRQRILDSLALGNVDPATLLLRARQNDLESRIAEIYAVPAMVPTYEALAQMPFTGVINMSWDSSLLDAFRVRSPVVIGGSSEEVLTAAKSQEFAFTWFAGDPNSEQIAISPGEVRARLFANETLSRFLTGSVQSSSSLLFVGVRASDVTDFFDALAASSTGLSQAIIPSQHHFAVCVIDELWELNRSQLRDGFGVELIGYDPADVGALARIVQRLLNVSPRTTVQTGTPMQNRLPRQVLNRITLTNIGAFERLNLELGKAWNLLLGINGCGKTTLLRAVALGLCGDHTLALEAGAGLLRTGCDHGLIELKVGSSRFRTELHRTPDMVRVRTSSLSPLEKGGWVVLGFPALRGMSLTAPSGISNPQAAEPTVEDLLPLLRNQVDTRLDDIKQWIINIEARREMGDERARHMLDRFFGVLGDLTPGIMLEFESVDHASWEVWVRTDDGVVSIDQLSQGMNSIFAWVGTLLQRMYDIYTNSDDPAAEPACVLIDELDAHLHPAWQRLLPSLTRKHFPQAQFLATSHSPLVAGSLRRGELFVAERVPRIKSDDTEYLVATVTPVDVDPEGLRADQVLTSPLFGLMTSRSPGFGNKVDRYDQLMMAASPTPEEEAEMRSLKSMISASYRGGETAAEREDQARQEIDLEQTLADVEPTEQNIAALRRLADELGAAGGLEET